MEVQLQENNDKLVLEFDSARSDLAALRDTLHDHVLTQLKLELALTDPDIAWLSEWLSDTGTLFSPSYVITAPSTLSGSMFRLLRVSDLRQGHFTYLSTFPSVTGLSTLSLCKKSAPY